MSPRTVTAAAYPPTARRTRWHAVVATCPFRQGAHVHYGSPDEPLQGTVLAGCQRGRYDVTPNAATSTAVR